MKFTFEFFGIQTIFDIKFELFDIKQSCLPSVQNSDQLELSMNYLAYAEVLNCIYTYLAEDEKAVLGIKPNQPRLSLWTC